MDKMKQETADLTARNVEKIAALFPNCVTEMRDEKGKVTRGIDFAILKQMLSPAVVEGAEHYAFTWVGKKAALVEANKSIRKTLRPCPEESKDWDTTENLYIEGDNLEVLKLLQESYLGKVKMIYIDPPYNTGNDFIYADNFMRSQQEENAKMGASDEEDNRLFRNTDTNGRFHSDWCSMMYSRLMLARNLLAEDGVVFISIDDNEQANLKHLCDEIFGADNFVAQFVWEKKRKASNLDGQVRGITEYVLCYRRVEEVVLSVAEDVPEENKPYPFYNTGNKRAVLNFPGERIRTRLEDGTYLAGDYRDEKTLVRLLTNVTVKNGVIEEAFSLEGEWRYSQKKFDELLAKNEIIVLKGTKFKPYWLNNEERVKKIRTLLTKAYYDVGTNEDGNTEVAALFGKDIFSFPKPVALVKKLIESVGDDKSIVLDFFSGSATTAHAVMQLNAEDGGKRKFIMVQLPEPCDKKSSVVGGGV